MTHLDAILLDIIAAPSLDPWLGVNGDLAWQLGFLFIAALIGLYLITREP